MSECYILLINNYPNVTKSSKSMQVVKIRRFQFIPVHVAHTLTIGVCRIFNLDSSSIFINFAYRKIA